MDGTQTLHQNGNTDTHPLVSLLSACFWVILWLLSWAKALVAFVTISIPRSVYSVLSYSMTLTLNFWSFSLLFVLSAVALNYWIRFRYLEDYAHLKEPPLLKPDAKELHPDVNTDPPPPFHNYLDDFLQAVRVFGFLEKPVFHELARHLQTRRLIAGDSISLGQDKSFYCVIDGMVQVYAQTGRTTDDKHGVWENEDMNGFQLLNEVGSGGTVSSLFTILSLFTEDVKMSWQDEHVENDDILAFGAGVESLRESRARANSDVSQLELEREMEEKTQRPAAGRRRRSSTSSTTSTVHAATLKNFNVPPSSRSSVSSPLLEEEFVIPESPAPRSEFEERPHDLVARAAEDTTLAVIPAEAFRRLTKKYPKAAGHIVQVILTRFSRVTFNAAHKYLGLTSEVLRTEKAINDIANHPLPPSFYEGGGLQYLRQRFDSTDTEGVSSETDYFSSASMPQSPGKGKGKTKTPSTARPTHSISSGSSTTTFASPLKLNIPRYTAQAGDLLTSTYNAEEGGHNRGPITRSFSILNTPRVSSRSPIMDNHRRAKSGNMFMDDFDLREEVMSCIAKSIGLLQPPLSGSDSVDASPAFTPSEPRQRSLSGSGPQLFKSSFSSLSLLDLADDASSVTGGSSTIATTDGYMSGLDNEVEMLYFPAGSTLAKAGEHNSGKGLFYVIEGFLDILLPMDSDRHSNKPPSAKAKTPFQNEAPQKDNRKHLFTVKPGGIAGYLASLCHSPSYVDIIAKTDVYVGFLPSHALERILEKRPIVLLTLAKRLISLLSPLVLHIDASLDWVQVNAGQVLWRPNDTSDSFYIVINGRLRVIADNKEDDGVNIVGEYGQGDTVGELDVITSSPRRNTAHAIRDTELIRMPQTLFNAISARNPETTAQLLRMIASRVRDEVDAASHAPSRTKFLSEQGYNNNLKTIAILPVNRNIPVEAFAKKLQAALEGIGATTAFLTQGSMSSHLGRHAFTRMGKLKAAGWLADQEQRFRTVLYVVDSAVNSNWTQTCIRQADCVMVVGMGDDPTLGEYERLLLSMKTTARKELILLHPTRSVIPGSTREWLKNRPWIHQHIHVELPGLTVPISKITLPKDPDPMSKLRNLKDKVQHEIQKYRGGTHDPRPQRAAHVNDFSRLARRICGKSIGLVLGGGGARGIAHLGLIRALEEYGIPIDHIGGTSIGSFIGGLYAREGDILSSAGRAKQFSGRMGNIWRILSDVTYPIVAYTTGHEFNRSIYKAFYDLHIEDMWLPFYCNTTNINTSRMEIHDTGYAWRFIRGSMTLVGLLPPLCHNGSMLVDGGYVDNLPVSTMVSMGASAVFACDVGSIDDNSPRNFGDSVSGWWLFINRWNPFSAARYVPAITEIQSRLAYVSSVKTLEDAKVTPGCLYIQMPVQDYGTLQFSKFEELQKVGYEAATKILDKWADEGVLPSAVISGSPGTSTKGRTARRNSI
ncbi:phosphatidylcholine and lysophosphatidylcholine phospholipase [Marasmius crinis-equi]|uniref:Lysophospholipase NTE1 n=1 Tax=Marasmius crinis-equi TaxID=585013 RepID=A0ABR3FYR1_9AGAR